MNPFIWFMSLRAAYRAAKEYDKTPVEERQAAIDAYFKPFEDGLNGVGPKTEPTIRKPFKIMLLILVLAVVLSMVIGGH